MTRMCGRVSENKSQWKFECLDLLSGKRFRYHFHNKLVCARSGFSFFSFCFVFYLFPLQPTSRLELFCRDKEITFLSDTCSCRICDKTVALYTFVERKSADLPCDTVMALKIEFLERPNESLSGFPLLFSFYSLIQSFMVFFIAACQIGSQQKISIKFFLCQSY